MRPVLAFSVAECREVQVGQTDVGTVDKLPNEPFYLNLLQNVLMSNTPTSYLKLLTDLYFNRGLHFHIKAVTCSVSIESKYNQTSLSPFHC